MNYISQEVRNLNIQSIANFFLVEFIRPKQNGNRNAQQNKMVHTIVK